jgi:hypothetical protein
VGEVLRVPEFQGVDFIYRGPEMKRFCATNGFAMTFEHHGETTELLLDSVIYLEGFNQATFRKTLEALRTCVGEIESLIGRV